jgi:acyl-coenzyme A synthetase/AMP-(fatty) acid ligase
MFQHDVKGQFPYAFVTLSDSLRLTPEMVAELKKVVRERIGAVSLLQFR